MTTIINTPPNNTEDSSAGMVIGIIFGVLIVALLLIFGVPYFRNWVYPQTSAVPNNPTTVNVTVPAAPSTDTTGATK
jgi:hypothetical protein